ncbi:MAG: hypothetical protein ACO23C_06670 [Prochlorococcaceae cyanobacterium]
MQPDQAAWGLSWPSLGRPEQAGEQPEQMLAPQPPAGRLQEVQPPVAVQQLQQALADRTPHVEILSPRDGATLADGPWQLKLKVRDWPLADGGALGLGAHVVVQIDDQELQRVSGAEAEPWQPANRSRERSLVIPQGPLGPGSHRITVYAARPWGEAVKSPGAAQQIRLHQLAANPQSLPAPGSPQLLPVSPDAANGAEPLLLDWLLLDAPLQHLRDGDGSWRLRVTINGDSFVLDQAVPLWLRGWKSGRNTLQLELLDGSGAALNAPFNSFVKAIELATPGSTPDAAKPRWQLGRLSNDELAILLGEQPPTPPEPEAQEPLAANNAQTVITPPLDPRQQHEELAPNEELQESAALPEPVTPKAAPGGESEQRDPPLAQAAPEDDLNAPTTQQPASQDRATSQDQAARSPGQPEPPAQELQDEHSERMAPANTTAELEVLGTPEQEQLSDPQQSSQWPETAAATLPAESAQLEPEPTLDPQADQKPDVESEAEAVAASLAEAEAESEAASELEPNPSDQPTPETQLAPSELVESSGSVSAVPIEEDPIQTGGLELSATAPEAPEATSAELPLQIAPPERISSSTPLVGSARDQVNPDGSLIQPSPNGPLAALRQLLGGS